MVAGVRQHLDELIADCDRRLTALEGEIAAALQDDAWAASLACLLSAPGIGLVTAAWLLVGTRNFARATSPAAVVGCQLESPPLIIRSAGSRLPRPVVCTVSSSGRG